MRQKNKTRNAEKLDEGFLDALIGQTGAAGLRAMSTKGMSTREQLTQDIFIKDFVADAVGALNGAIQSGMVDPNISSAPDAGAQQNQSYKSSTVTGGSNVPPAAKTQPQATAAQKPAAGAQQNYAAPSSVTRGGNIPPASKSLIRKPINYTKNQPGLKENHYRKLNDIFESILEANGGQSIEKFLQNWFASYMSGINYSGYQNDVNRLISQVAATYGKDRGVKALQGLATAAYSISKVAGAMPKDNEASKSTTQPPQTTSAQSQIDLSKMDDNQISALLKQVYAEYNARRQKTATNPPQPAATRPTQDAAGRIPPEDIAEARRRK